MLAASHVRDTSETELVSVAFYERASLAAGIAVAIAGAVVLADWWLHIDDTKRMLPGLAAMKFNTALCFVLSGISLCVLQRERGGPLIRRSAHLCALLVFAVAMLTLLEYQFGWNAHIDELAVPDPGAVAPLMLPGRMSMLTAVGFFSLAAAILLIDVELRRGWRPAQFLALLSMFIGATALVGYVFGVQQLYSATIYSSMGLYTTLLFIIAGLGVLVARPDRGLMAVLTSKRIGGRISRFVLPVLLIPVALSWLSQMGLTLGIYGTDLAFALNCLTSIAALAVLIWLGAHRLNRMHERVEHANQLHAFLATIVESSNDAIVTKNLSGIVTTWNPGAERIYGYTAAEMLARPLAWLLPPERQNEEQEILAKVSQGEQLELETIRRRKDGRLIDMSITISPITDEYGTVIGASNIGRDITDRKRAEERFRLVVDAAPSAMIMVNRDGRIVLVNSLTETMFGYPRYQLIGQSIETLVPERFRSDHPGYRTTFFNALKNRAIGAGRNFYGLRKDGSEFPAEIALNPIETSEGVYVISAITDITERTRAEKELRGRTEELSRSNQDLEQFAYVASHDLQEPLRAVGGSLQLLQRRYEGQLDARADEFIEHAVDGVVRMQTLIEDLLTYSRMGRQEDPYEPTDCEHALDQALKNLNMTIRETGAQVRRNGLPTVPAIPTQLSLLFQNLVGNAIKFRRKDNPVHINVTAEPRGNEWLFQVADNGIGIDPQYFQRIFLIFQRLHTRREYAGTGIGLALCKRIVERHGGRIWVESAPGTGTTFFFTLPSTA